MAQPQRPAGQPAKAEWLAAKRSAHQPGAHVDREALPRRLAHEVPSLAPTTKVTRRPRAHRTDD